MLASEAPEHKIPAEVLKKPSIFQAAHPPRGPCASKAQLRDVESEHAVDEIELGVLHYLLRLHVLHVVDHSYFHFLPREFERFLVDLHVSLRDFHLARGRKAEAVSSNLAGCAMFPAAVPNPLQGLSNPLANGKPPADPIGSRELRRLVDR